MGGGTEAAFGSGIDGGGVGRLGNGPGDRFRREWAECWRASAVWYTVRARYGLPIELNDAQRNSAGAIRWRDIERLFGISLLFSNALEWSLARCLNVHKAPGVSITHYVMS